MRNPPPWSTLTVIIPATDPENATTPPAAALTGVPNGTPTSTPQCPP